MLLCFKKCLTWQKFLSKTSENEKLELGSRIWIFAFWHVGEFSSLVHCDWLLGYLSFPATNVWFGRGDRLAECLPDYYDNVSINNVTDRISYESPASPQSVHGRSFLWPANRGCEKPWHSFANSFMGCCPRN